MLFRIYSQFRFLGKVHLLGEIKRLVTFKQSMSELINNNRDMYQIIEKGSIYTDNYRIYLKNENGPISFFHDIPLYADNSKKIFNMVVEIPRWTNAKMEINLKEPLNPIKQDIKKGKVRFVSNCFPHHGYIWNYGAIPQTWENPLHLDDSTGCKGDNDPIDVLEIGYKVAKRGQILGIKILGCIALIDEGETDWKIIAIDHEDPIAGQVNDAISYERWRNETLRIKTTRDYHPKKISKNTSIIITLLVFVQGNLFCFTIPLKMPMAEKIDEAFGKPDLKDVEKFFPGLLKATIEWFKIYKIPDGKPENQFAFNGEIKDKDFAINIIEQVHFFWKQLVNNEVNGGEISCSNLTITGSPFKLEINEANDILNKAPAAGSPGEVDPIAVEKWYFIKLQKE